MNRFSIVIQLVLLATVLAAQGQQDCKNPELLVREGATIALPDSGVLITSPDGDSIEFEISQLWNQDGVLEMLAVDYREDLGTTTCDKNVNVEPGEILSYKAACIAGFAEVHVYAYLGGDGVLNVAECEGCEDVKDDTNMVSYSFEFACDLTCEPPGVPPKPCVDTVPAVPMEQAGANVAFPDKAIEIDSSDGDSVEFTISQLWEQNGLVRMLAVHYHTSIGSTDCDKNMDVGAGFNFSYTATCIAGFAELTVFLYVGDGDGFNPTECKGCEEPKDGDPNLVSYYFEIPCECVPAPSDPTPAPNICEDPHMEITGANVQLPNKAIEVVSFNGDSIDFRLSQLWDLVGPVKMISVHLHASSGLTDCEKNIDVEAGAELLYTAVCIAGFAEVNVFVYVGEGEFNPGECDGCEMPGEDDINIVSYYFEIPCACNTPLVEPSLSPATPGACVDASPEKTVGASVEMPIGAVEIVSPNGDDVEFQISQLWNPNGLLRMIAVHYHDSLAVTDCDKNENVPAGTSLSYTAACVDGFAEVNVFVFLGDDAGFVSSECGGCEMPNENDTKVVSYYFELSCDCEKENVKPTPSPGPEVCKDPMDYTYVNATGVDLALPNKAIEVVSANGHSVDFRVSQLWELHGELKMIAVHYHESFGMTDCDQNLDVSGGAQFSYKAACIEGFAEIMFFVHVGGADDFDLNDCDVCNQPTDNIANIATYYFELPCYCEPSEKSAPTSAPIEIEVCSGQMTASGTVDKFGGDVDWPQKAVEIVSSDGASIEIKLSQLWDLEGSVLMLSAHFHDEEPQSMCEKNIDVDPSTEFSYTVLCLDEFAELDVYVYVGEQGDFDVNSCDGCASPDGTDPNLVSYYIELPCDMTCEPATAPTYAPTDDPTIWPTGAPISWEPDCPSDVVLVANDGVTNYTQSPIEIIKQDGQTVTFKLHQIWTESVSYIYTQYHGIEPGVSFAFDAECFETQNLKKFETIEISAMCMTAVPITVVDIWLSDSFLHPTLDTAKVPACCHRPESDTNPTVNYSFKIYCESNCPTDEYTSEQSK